jgi:hypothetical protein
MSSNTAPARREIPISRWIRDGGPQEASGAFCGWLDRATGRLSPPYPEITGYVLGSLAQGPLDPTDRDPAEMARAAAAVRWLAERAASRDFAARPGAGTAVYPFDVAMIAHGLIRFGRAFDDPHAIDVGLAHAELLVDVARRHGSIPAVVPGTASTALPEAWSTRGRPHLLKVAQALLSAHELGLPGALDTARRLVLDALSTPDPLETCPGSDVISLHALCYAAEGLWVWGVATDDTAALSRSREITRWVWRHRDARGAFPGFVHRRHGVVGVPWQSDVQAQAVRLAELHDLRDLDIESATARLLDGTWRAGRHAAVHYRPGTAERHLNTWASLFAAQALELRSSASPDLEWSELV